jgi:beta-lactamase superfamily II metal-dependent hydrolase
MLNRRRAGIFNVLSGILKSFGAVAIILILVYTITALHGSNRVNGVLGELEVTFLRLADSSECTILQLGDTAVLIDSGSSADAERIISAMSEKGITSLYALVLTNPDEGYIGGAAQILRSFPMATVFLPAYQKQNPVFDNLSMFLNDNEIPTIIPQYNRNFSMGDVIFTILPSFERSYKQDGNYSLGVIVNFGETKMFFAGNADKKRTLEMLEYTLPQVYLYKIPANGKSNQYSANLIEHLNPQIAIITSSKMDKEIITALSSVNCDIVSAKNEDVSLTFQYR